MNDIDINNSDLLEKDKNTKNPISEKVAELDLKPLHNYKATVTGKDIHKNNLPKNLPSKMFINQEFYKKFNVSKAKEEFNVAGEVPELVEVSFKNKRKSLYLNENKLALLNYQYIIVNVENGIDIGTIVSFGKCAEAKMHSKYHDKEPIYTLNRHPKLEDMEKHKQNLDDITDVLFTSREYVEKNELDMKITDAEWQFDRLRLTIFFTAPMRIDFRQLVKDLARIFRTRIELRQISSREEAKRIGGMGSCGRVLCCASFACEHCHVTLEHAKTQQLPNNVTKLSGYCGRLKCCLLYEFKTYVDTFQKYPPMDSVINFPEGRARIFKADIFKELVFAYIPEVSTYKTISFQEFCELHQQGKVHRIDDNGKTKELRRMLIDPDEADLEELKHLED